MDRNPPASVRQIAKMTGYSKATVANALNGAASVAPETAERIKKVAMEIGYRRNPMVGSVMSAMRLSQTSSLQGVLAVAEIREPERPDHGPFHADVLAGCRQAAGELGFGLEFFQVEPRGLSPERLSGVLKARGIRGLVLLPAWRMPDFSRFDWSELTGIYTDYIPEAAALNTVCCDHYRTVLELMERLYEKGYRRPAMLFEKGRDERIHMRMSAAFRAFQASRGDVAAIEPIFLERIDREVVMDWIGLETPDVVLTHDAVCLDWIQESGRRIPLDIGFVSLNLAKMSKPCAGLDLRPRDIGRCAVELLIAQVQRQAWGRESVVTNTSVQGVFVSGPTVR